MFSPKYYLLFGLLLTLLLEPSSGRKGFGGGHSYPKSGGLSGGGHRSGGLSGGGHAYPSSSNRAYPSSGQSHAYPSSGQSHNYPSSGQSHAYPSSGQSHNYPSSGQSHNYPSSGQSHNYPSSGQSHNYPSSGQSHGYPSSGQSHGYPSGSGLSGNNRGSANTGRTTNIYNNYHYSPPQQISYTPLRGGPQQSFPVYHGQPPTYVYKYKNSDSKYGTLLAGLALMNLGTLGVAAYAATRNSHSSSPSSSGSYTSQPGEVCKFGVKKDNGDYEETRIDCQIISAFIMQDQTNHPSSPSGTNSTVTTTTTVTNMTTVNGQVVPEQPQPAAPLFAMLPNGTLVQVNATVPVNTLVNQTAASPNGTMTSSVTVTTTTTNTTLVNALDVKGKPVQVTPGMQCFIIRHSPISNMRKNVDCGLLQTYADRSIRRNAATQHAPMFTIVAAVVAYCVAY